MQRKFRSRLRKRSFAKLSIDKYRKRNKLFCGKFIKEALEMYYDDKIKVLSDYYESIKDKNDLSLIDKMRPLVTIHHILTIKLQLCINENKD